MIKYICENNKDAEKRQLLNSRAEYSPDTEALLTTRRLFGAQREQGITRGNLLD